MPRPFVSAGLVASIVAGVVALGAAPAAATDGEGPPPEPIECVTAYIATPVNRPSVTACSPIEP